MPRAQEPMPPVARAIAVARASPRTVPAGVVAVVCGAWTVVFLIGQPPLALLAVPWVVAGTAVARRYPIAGALGVAAASWTTWATGVGWGNVDMVLPAAHALFLVGRARVPWLTGPVLVLLVAVPNALRDGLRAGDLVLTALMFGTMWGIGVVVRQRLGGEQPPPRPSGAHPPGPGGPGRAERLRLRHARRGRGGPPRPGC